MAVAFPLAAHPATQPPAARSLPRRTNDQRAADTLSKRHFDVPPQSLGDALVEFSRQAELRVFADSAPTTGIRSTRLRGEFTAADALRRLLSDTGFSALFSGSNSVVVSRSSIEELPVLALPMVVVSASAERRRGYGASHATALRTDVPLRHAPQSVTVVSHELIADQAMQSMGDVVRYVPGVTMGLGEGHRDAPTIRGNSSTADFFVDGVRDDAPYLRDLYNVERIEALKGSNAMLFGRGGGGGVINRASKEAQWTPTRMLRLESGSFDHSRGSLDIGQGLGAQVAGRFNGMYESSNTFRDATNLTRYGVHPTATILVGARSFVQLGYEYFRDTRTVDRGIPSLQGRPSHADVSTFFGDPDLSRSRVLVQSGGVTIEHQTSGTLMIRNRTRFADYDKFYQNVFPGAVDSTGSMVGLSAYDDGIVRQNLFNATDVTYGVNTGIVRHSLLVGAEVGRQTTRQRRRTGYFDGDATTLKVPFDHPTVTARVSFRQSATDADGRSTTRVAAMYAQNQVELSEQWQAIVGVRYEHFEMGYRNNRNGQELRRGDDLVAPRAGLVFKPAAPFSLYGGYSLSFLPGSGDQFTTLTVTSQTLEPERFTNREIGAKWEIRPALMVTTAIYRVDRTNTSAPDPTDPSSALQTGRQRTTGYELGVSGDITHSWQMAGGYAMQRATIVSATTAARAGATVPLVPRQTASLWNKVQLSGTLGAGLGVIHQTKMFAAIDNSVTLPGFTRLDGALYVSLTRGVRGQLNVENLLDERYYGTSHGNNGIMPGAPRTVRLALMAGL